MVDLEKGRLVAQDPIGMTGLSLSHRCAWARRCDPLMMHFRRKTEPQRGDPTDHKFQNQNPHQQMPEIYRKRPLSTSSRLPLWLFIDKEDAFWDDAMVGQACLAGTLWRAMNPQWGYREQWDIIWMLRSPICWREFLKFLEPPTAGEWTFPTYAPRYGEACAFAAREIFLRSAIEPWNGHR